MLTYSSLRLTLAVVLHKLRNFHHIPRCSYNYLDSPHFTTKLGNHCHLHRHTVTHSWYLLTIQARLCVTFFPLLNATMDVFSALVSVAGGVKQLEKLVLSVKHSQIRLHFNRQASLLYVYHLDLREQGRMMPLRLLRMPQDVEAIAAFLATENEDERVIVPLPPRAQGVIRIVCTQNFDELVFNGSFDSSAGAAICDASVLPSSRGYYVMSNQWRRRSIDAWFEAPSYLLSDNHRKGMIQTIKKMCVLEHDDHSLTREFVSKAF